jgi:Zn-finger nucleic acid-binding protein
MSATTPFDCPRCGAGLSMSERQGIEIDYCPQCRGVWLDRGELDKIIERVAPPQEPPAPGQPAPGMAPQPSPGGWTQPPAPPPPQQQPWGGGRHGYGQGHGHEGHGYGHGGKRRKSWLQELFD